MTEQKTYTLEDLRAMPADEVAKLFATPGAQYIGTAVVRDKHGNAKYDDPAKAGQYGDKE